MKQSDDMLYSRLQLAWDLGHVYRSDFNHAGLKQSNPRQAVVEVLNGRDVVHNPSETTAHSEAMLEYEMFYHSFRAMDLNENSDIKPVMLVMTK